ncbi:MAG: undecaprenyl-diphosphate phosphatase [Rhodospirillales bacterium]
MPLYLLAILALVQGITEFLPISSSGHLDLTWIAFHGLGEVPATLDARQELVLDVAVHVGTLAAVCLYYWRDLWAMVLGLARAASGRRDPGARLVLLLVLATLPVVLVGYFVADLLPLLKGDLELIGWTTLGFGLLLWLADRSGMTYRRIEHLGLPDVLILGLAQTLALIPGTSRSGITMTAARLVGMERQDAARFSMLMSIPTIAAAGLLTGLEMREIGSASLSGDAVIAALLAFGSALLAIAVLMAWLKRASFLPFVIYRVLLGGGLLYLVYSGTLAAWGWQSGL